MSQDKFEETRPFAWKTDLCIYYKFVVLSIAIRGNSNRVMYVSKNSHFRKGYVSTCKGTLGDVYLNGKSEFYI